MVLVGRCTLPTPAAHRTETLRHTDILEKTTATITTSVDGYITGPNDGPGRGLGEGGPALHSWVFGGPWDYDDGPKGEATGEDKAFLDEAMANLGAVIAEIGRAHV